MFVYIQLNVPSHPLQLETKEASVAGSLLKLSLTLMAGGAAVYYIHVRNPTTIPTLLANLRPQTA